jgi:hypothetical protein
MSDLREQVARGIRDHVHNVPVLYMDSTDDYIGGIDEAADAALSVAEPIIRADELHRLIEKALDDFGPEDGDELAGWLRAQAGKPDDRKIYIGFKDKDKDHE